MSVKGFKAMTSDMKCRDFQFKEGKTYTTDKIQLCSAGFHFCENVMDVYNYYEKSENTVICEVEALGEVQKEGDKSVTNKIKIVKKLTEKEVLAIWIKRNNSGNRNSGDWNSGDGNSGHGNSGNRNSGDGNSGDGNSGNRNSGNRNSGYGNSGNENSGDWNSGDGNSGYGNSGYGNSGNRNSGDGNSGYGNSGYGNSGNRNSGDWNSGDGNSGYGNSGNRNSGDWNSGDGNSGYFNTAVPLYFFNKPSTLAYTKELENRLRSLNVKPILTWTPTSQMTEEEQTNNPPHKVTGGFLRKTERYDWRYLTEEDKKFIKTLPNFDDAIFQQITHVSLSDDVEVTVNGVVKKISREDAKKLGLVE